MPQGGVLRTGVRYAPDSRDLPCRRNANIEHERSWIAEAITTERRAVGHARNDVHFDRSEIVGIVPDVSRMASYSFGMRRRFGQLVNPSPLSRQCLRV